MDYGLAGKTVLVTGAGKGIGRAIAQAFIEQGCRLLAIDRDADALEQAFRDLPGESARVLDCDLGNADAVVRLQEDVRGFGGTVDVLVNNAGVEYPTPIDAADPVAQERWDALLGNNVGSMARAVRALLPAMGRDASIINQASIWGLTGVAGFSAYVASKHAVIGLTRSLAWELAPRGIRVNAVCPGWIRTDAALRSLAAMSSSQARPEDEVLEDILAAQALPILLEPADIAGVYLFLASRDARPITGQAIVVSNGEVMH